MLTFATDLLTFCPSVAEDATGPVIVCPGGKEWRFDIWSAFIPSKAQTNVALHTQHS